MLTIPKKQGLRLAGTVLFLSLIFACTTGPPHFRRSYDVSNTFENFITKGDYQYYYNGLPYRPDAVVGVRPGYRLISPHWHAVDMTSKRLRHMVGEMLNNPGAEYNTEPNGAYVLNDKGEVIGIWYSVWALPVLNFTAEREFAISQPIADFPRSNRDPEERAIWPYSRPY